MVRHPFPKCITGSKATYEAHVAQVKQRLAKQYGESRLEEKIDNYRDIGAQAMSVISFHNEYYRQSRSAFILGAYYPGLTGTVSLGERMLNQLVIGLRDAYCRTTIYSRVKRQDSFNNWNLMIDALESWGVLLPDVVQAFRELEGIRQRSVHFFPASEDDMRAMAVFAIQHLDLIIGRQFGILANQPWFIPGIAGSAYIGKAWEAEPFIQTFLLPHSVLVGPDHWLERDDTTGLWSAHDVAYAEREVTDEEFRSLLVNP